MSTKTLTITPTPSTATVTLTSSDTTASQSGNSISAEQNSTVSYSVSKSGYYTKQDTVLLTDDASLSVSLTSYPSTAKTAYMNGVRYDLYAYEN